jgi:hypothetical protein
MSFFKTIEIDAGIIWNDVEKLGSLIDGLVEAIITEEYQVVFKTELVPLVQTAITNLQNESPGLAFKDFIPAIVAQILPILPVALKDIEQGLIVATVGYLSTLAGVSNATGNAGNLAGGTQVGG